MRRVGRILLKGLVALSLLLCVASFGLMIAARRCDGLKLDVGRADGRIGSAQVRTDGAVALLLGERWPHPTVASFTHGPPGQRRPGERDFRVWVSTYIVDRGVGRFQFISGRGTPSLYDGPNGGTVRPPARPMYLSAATVPFNFLSFPAWILPAAFALPSLALLARRGLSQRAKRRRVERGLCPWCAYDLRGNVSGACPECGSAVPESAAGGSTRPNMHDVNGKSRMWNI